MRSLGGNGALVRPDDVFPHPVADTRRLVLSLSPSVRVMSHLCRSRRGGLHGERRPSVWGGSDWSRTARVGAASRPARLCFSLMRTAGRSGGCRCATGSRAGEDFLALSKSRVRTSAQSKRMARSSSMGDFRYTAMPRRGSSGDSHREMHRVATAGRLRYRRRRVEEVSADVGYREVVRRIERDFRHAITDVPVKSAIATLQDVHI